MGGAIRDDVRKMEISTRPPTDTIQSILRNASFLEGNARLPEVLHGMVSDMNQKNMFAMYQYYPSYSPETEKHLHDNLKSLLSGHGAKKDHPIVAKTVAESFKHIPELARLYIN